MVVVPPKSRMRSTHPPEPALTDRGLTRLLCTRDVALFLGVHEQTVRRMAGRGELPCVRVGSRLRFVPSDITRWVRQRKE